MKAKETYTIKELTGFSLEEINAIAKAVEEANGIIDFDAQLMTLPKRIYNRLLGDQVDYLWPVAYESIYRGVKLKEQVILALMRGNLDM